MSNVEQFRGNPRVTVTYDAPAEVIAWPVIARPIPIVRKPARGAPSLSTRLAVLARMARDERFPQVEGEV